MPRQKKTSNAGRPSGDKTRCSGTWTEARYKSFIKSLLRHGTMRWKPVQDCKKEARTRRGFYRCAGCGEEVPASLKEGRTRKNNIHVDHIAPIIDPATGFTTWDDCIERMFCETDNLQVLCTSCHDIKTNAEKQVAKERREREKNEKQL